MRHSRPPVAEKKDKGSRIVMLLLEPTLGFAVGLYSLSAIETVVWFLLFVICVLL